MPESERSEAQAQLVAALERSLEDARNGDITGYFMAIEHTDGACSSAVGPCENHFALCGAVLFALIKHMGFRPEET
jgi:hypothetical protein